MIFGQVPDRHSRYLILRNVRDAPTLSSALLLPLAAARYAAAAALECFSSRGCCTCYRVDGEEEREPLPVQPPSPLATQDCRLVFRHVGPPAGKETSESDRLSDPSRGVSSAAHQQAHDLQAASDDCGVRRVLEEAFRTAVTLPPAPRPLVGANLLAEAAAAAAAKTGSGGAWATALPLSAAARGRKFTTVMLVLAMAALLRLGLAAAVFAEDYRVQVMACLQVYGALRCEAQCSCAWPQRRTEECAWVGGFGGGGEGGGRFGLDMGACLAATGCAGL